MEKFWDNKKVLITGYEGFLGSNLTKSLIGLNAGVIGLDIKVNRQETVLAKKDYRQIKIIEGSVCDLGLLKMVLRRYSIDVVFHLAAESIVSRCNKEPLLSFDTNIRGTWNLLEACRCSGNRIRSIVAASSDKAYGTCRNLPYKESFALAGKHPYDVSKSCMDLISQAFAHTYGLPVTISRCGNIYGPGDFNFARLVPDAFRCLGRNKTLLVRSDGKFVRDYIYIDDVVKAYLMLARSSVAPGLAGQAFNFSTNRPVAVTAVLEQINKVCPERGRLRYRILNQAKYEIKEQYLSSEKARRILGWRPEYSLKQGLIKTAEWYLSKFH